jgi:hypothetical protein
LSPFYSLGFEPEQQEFLPSFLTPHEHPHPFVICRIKRAAANATIAITAIVCNIKTPF